MNNEQKKFRIDQLRKDKIIWGVEACVVNTCAIIGTILVDKNIDGNLGNILISLGIVFAFAYSIWASVGNIKRHKEIKRLEKEFFDS